MKQEENYLFNVTISSNSYNHKPTSYDYSHMTWEAKANISINDFDVFIRKGYSYCHIYKNNVRSKANFLYTQVVNIDVDDSTMSMGDFISGLAVKPSYAYTTCSNGIKGYRFRLLYCFEDRITKEQYPLLYSQIIKRNNLKLADNCGKTISQLMNGNGLPQVESYKSDYIYNINDFLKESTYTINDIDIPSYHCTNTSVSSLTSQHHLSSSILYDSNVKNETNIKGYKGYVMRLLNKYSTLSNEDIIQFITKYESVIDDYCSIEDDKDFLDKYSQVPIFQHTPIEYDEEGIKVFDEDEEYYALFVPYYKRDGKWHIKRYTTNRHNKLYAECCLLRCMDIDAMDFEILLINTVSRKKAFYNNQDGELDKKFILRTVISVLFKDINELKRGSSKHPKVTTSKEYCLKHGLNRRKYSHKAVKMNKHREIGSWYDCSLPITENYNIAVKNNWFKGSLRTLYRFCKDNNIDCHQQRISLRDWYDLSKSVKENLDYAQQHDIKTSRASIYRYLKQLK